MADLASAALGTGAKVGRYFNVVSFVPSLLFVLYLGALLRAGAWFGPLHPSRALFVPGLDDASAVVAVTLIALAIGFALHPFQFAATQLLEGYWGTSQLARRLATGRTRRHQSRALDLEIAAAGAELEIRAQLLKSLSTADRASLDALPTEKQDFTLEGMRGTRAGLGVTPLVVLEEAARHARGAYPHEVDRVRPTRLGNALRRFEDAAGRSYGLDAITVAPHLSLVADTAHIAWQADARRQLDFSIRVCLLALFATPITAALLSDNGAWVFLTLAPFTVAYLAYRGAISSARGYGTAVTTVLDLNRFRLYRELHLTLPSTSAEERVTNGLLLRSLGDELVDLRYDHPDQETSSDPPAAATEVASVEDNADRDGGSSPST